MNLFFLKKLGRFLLPSFFIFFVLASVQAKNTTSLSKKNKIVISNNLKENFIFLISEMGEIHRNIKETNITQFHSRITELINNLEQIRPFKELHLPYHRKIYLNRQFRLIEDHLRFVIQDNLSSSKKNTSLKKIYKELIQIYHSYILDEEIKHYAVYYCPKNESAWIQKNDMEIYNPFSPNHRKCGAKIR